MHPTVVKTDAAPRKGSEVATPMFDRRLFDALPEAALVLRDERITDCNPAATRFFGRRREDLHGRSPLDLSPERQPDGRLSVDVARQRLRLAGAGIRQTFAWQHLHGDGTRREAEVQLVPLSRGDRTAILALVRDEHVRRHAEDLYRSIFEHSGAPSVIVDAGMTIVRANPKFEELLGYRRAELERRMTWADLVHPEDLARMERYHRERRRPGGRAPTEYDCRFVDRQGGVKDIHLKVGMLPDGRCSILSLTDITARRAAEREARRRSEALSAIVEATDSLIYTCDREYRLGFMNRPLVERAGRSALGEKCFAVLHDRTAPCPWCPNDRVFAGESVRMEARSPKDGRWYYGVSSPIADADGRVRFKQAVLVDITERKEAEERLREKAAHLRQEVRQLRRGVRDRYRFGGLVGKSEAMQRVYDLILDAAGSEANTIVYGESGTGKELVARAIHDASVRSGRPFVPVNCGAIPESLMESEFFGYKKGAFSGAAADREGFLDAARGGTLFLDEIGELGLAMQVKLLRAIEGGGYTPVGGQRVQRTDVRIVAATNRDLEAMVTRDEFRRDLFYRVHVIPIRIPPLRERREDLPLLLEHFLQRCGGLHGPGSVDGRLVEAVLAHDWPGNIRELENVVRRYVTLGRVDVAPRPAAPVPEGPAGDGPLKDRVAAFERRVLRETLEACRWQKARAAERLGIHRKTLFTKLRQHGLES